MEIKDSIDPYCLGFFLFQLNKLSAWRRFDLPVCEVSYSLGSGQMTPNCSPTPHVSVTSRCHTVTLFHSFLSSHKAFLEHTEEGIWENLWKIFSQMSPSNPNAPTHPLPVCVRSSSQLTCAVLRFLSASRPEPQHTSSSRPHRILSVGGHTTRWQLCVTWLTFFLFFTFCCHQWPSYHCCVCARRQCSMTRRSHSVVFESVCWIHSKDVGFFWAGGLNAHFVILSLTTFNFVDLNTGMAVMILTLRIITGEACWHSPSSTLSILFFCPSHVSCSDI